MVDVTRPPTPSAVADLSSSSAFRLRMVGLADVLRLILFGLESMPREEEGCMKAWQVMARESRINDRDNIARFGQENASRGEPDVCYVQ